MRRKLVEVCLPLNSLNAAAQKDKNPFLKGHPRSLHLWWSRKPLPVCRAVLFASLVDDPSSLPHLFPSLQEQQKERLRLISLMESLVAWRSGDDSAVIADAREEICKSSGCKNPSVYDPFAGGGSIPLEAKRLGLNVYGADLNPLAVLINKAAIELPQAFVSAKELADEVRNYGNWISREARNRLGHLYSHNGNGAKSIAWLYCRSVKCPNLDCGYDVPLLSKYWLSTKPGRKTWLKPIVNGNGIEFEIVYGQSDNTEFLNTGTRARLDNGKAAKAHFQCLACNQSVKGNYIHTQAEIGQLGYLSLAVVSETERGRKFFSFSKTQMKEVFAKSRQLIAEYRETNDVPEKESHGTFASNAQGRRYGLRHFSDYFLPRQLLTLCVLTDLVQEASQKVFVATGDKKRADAVSVYLAFAANHLVRYSTLLNPWNTTNENVAQVFGRQAMQMTWDFAEANIIDGPLNMSTTTEWVARAVENLPASSEGLTYGVSQEDSAKTAGNLSKQDSFIIFTDPPYHDYVSYSDLSDFFLVWLERSLGTANLGLSYKSAPKGDELVIAPHRFDGDFLQARKHFSQGLARAFSNMHKLAHPDFPLPVFYAFNPAGRLKSTGDIDFSGWEIMIEALLSAGFMVTAVWTLATERSTRMVARNGSRSLSSSLLLVLRKRPQESSSIELKDLRQEVILSLPSELERLRQASNHQDEHMQMALMHAVKIMSRHQVIFEDGLKMTIANAIKAMVLLVQEHLFPIDL